jgi:FMN phosphatase YigB (HAD superfamily)
MKIIFDFDHTLFSTKKLYLEARNYFSSLSVSKEVFDESFKESKKGGKAYKPQNLFEIIHRKNPEISIDEMEKASREIADKFSDFIYPDVKSFLEEFKKNDLYIISYGGEDGSFSRGKIRKSGIRDYFKKVFITKNNSKVNALSKIIDEGEKAVFVDDCPEVLFEVKNSFPEVTTVRINRGEGRYKDQQGVKGIDFSVKNCEELKSILTEI